MLPTSAGVEPATSWSPVGRRIQLSHRGRRTLGKLFIRRYIEFFFIIIFCISLRKQDLTFMQMHEMSNPIFWRKKIRKNITNLSSAGLAKRVVKVEQARASGLPDQKHFTAISKPEPEPLLVANAISRRKIWTSAKYIFNVADADHAAKMRRQIWVSIVCNRSISFSGQTQQTTNWYFSHFFPENRLWHSCKRDNFHEMSQTVFWKKKKKKKKKCWNFPSKLNINNDVCRKITGCKVRGHTGIVVQVCSTTVFYKKVVRRACANSVEPDQMPQNATLILAYNVGPSCSKLTMSLVYVSLKLWSLNMAYRLNFLLKKECE